MAAEGGGGGVGVLGGDGRPVAGAGLELASGDGARGAAVRADLVPLLGLEGRFAEARELAAAIPAGCLSVEDEIRLRSGQARALSRQGRWAEAARALGAIAELVPGGAVRALFEARTAYALIFAGDVAGGRARAERIRDAALGRSTSRRSARR